MTFRHSLVIIADLFWKGREITLGSLPIFRRHSSNETTMTAAITSDLNNPYLKEV